ncbi:recombinase family protein [Afipia massiliensis]|uniref:Recombinase family protein n=1 Tax=Afipia massiliensis TaxID=211460 RepID=A0A4U6BUT1_9BRAD|nr:recombinase family protein [Afipia massiliensis]TKT72928.1 recombinase family protein [Afipia massiliensis]
MLLLENSAAQYVRMSTDMQTFSIENQSEAISLYAATRGLTIVCSYEDSGKSGLNIEGRPGLRKLIADVTSGHAEFKTILVYDVSRWGRFQDSDESAYYEFLCRESGVQVEYCAEQFSNDGSLSATVLKNIKRAMAGEFSRELSTKVFTGQSKIVTRGFYIGPDPGFGLRRCLVDPTGKKKTVLAFGEMKNIRSDRTILVPGPPAETNVIHRVYGLFIDKKLSISEIARKLNDEGIPNAYGRPWVTHSIRQLLSNEKYIGNSVFNRASKKFGKNWRRNPPSEWVRGLGVFEPVISIERFEQARLRLKENSTYRTDGDVLNSLTALWCCKGRLDIDLVLSSEKMPSPQSIKVRFGSLTQAYRLIGYRGRGDRDYKIKAREGMRKTIIEGVRKLNGTARRCSSGRHIIINEELRVGVGVGRRASGPNRHGDWNFGYRSQQKPDILVVARIDRGCREVRDYFIHPYALLPHGSWLTISGKNYARLDAFHTNTLEPFVKMCARRSLEASK